MTKLEDLLLLNFLYALGSFFLVYPPNEVIQIGLTIPNLFSTLLGSEQSSFVNYHIRRTSLTVLIHSVLPLGYYVFLACNFPEFQLFEYANLSVFWSVYLSASTLILVGLCTVVYYWSANGFVNHPISTQLSDSNGYWKAIADEINNEFKSIDKFATGGLYNRVYVTENWLIKVNLYSLNICRLTNIELALSHSSELRLTQDGTQSTQNLHIRVTPCHRHFKTFYVRINSLEYKDFNDKVKRPILEASDVVIRQSLPEQFLEAFKEQVMLNPVVHFKRSVTINYLI